jgi:predicted DNA-binding transcriptional regulator
MISEYFRQLELSEGDEKIYLYLLSNSQVSVQQVATGCELGRTAVYASIERLLKFRLLIEIVGKNGKLYSAGPIEVIEQLLKEKETKINSLEEELPDLVESLSQASSTKIGKAEIKYYDGQKGLEQITWNSTKANDFLRIYEIDDIDTLVGNDFSDKVMEEYVKNKVFDKQLTNLKEIDDCTTVTEFIDNWWEPRYVDPAEIKIQFETMIYNDVLCMYEYQDDKIFCVEIYNQKLAETQIQLFDFIWNFSKPLTKLNSFAAARLDE